MRAEIERREQEEERRELAREKKKAQKDAGQETDLVELGAEMALESEDEAEDAEADDAMSLAELDVEAHLDSLDAVQERSEAKVDAAEEAADLAEEAADIAVEDEAEASEQEQDAREEQALVELSADADAERKTKKSKAGKAKKKSRRARKTKLRPSVQVTYGGMPDFYNDDSRAVFHRRAHAKTVLRFERSLLSDGGQAVVKGLQPASCGRTMTDQGLFQAAISENLRDPVTAGEPNPPKRIDDNLRAIHHFPIVPQYLSTEKTDEYGDPVE